MRRFVFLTAAAFLSLLPANARADDLFECSISQLNTNGGWLPEVVAVAHKSGAATAIVNDPIIQYYKGKPIEATVEVDNAKRTTFTWTIDAKSASGQYANMSYRLTVMKSNLSASMAATTGRYSNSLSATGTCKRVKG